MRKQYYLLSAIAVLTACDHEAELLEMEQTLAPAITTINASTYAETRAAVSSTDNTKILWKVGDQISVLGTNAESTAKNLAYTLSSGDDTTDGVFANTTSDITSVAAVLYPYQADATCSSGALTCTIPSEQTATAGTFDPTSAIMYALGNSVNADLAFAVNFLKVTVSAEENVHSITVRSNTKLTGSVSITSTDVATTEESKDYVTLSAAGTGALATGSYYIAVAQTSSIEKPSIIYKYTDGTLAEKTGSTALSFAARKNVKPVSVNFSTGTVHRAVQLWDNGPYFATCNVGVTSQNDYGDYFAWGETVPYYADGNYWEMNKKQNMVWRTIEGRTITGYDWASYKYCNGTSTTLTKYCTESNYGRDGFVDNKSTLEAEDDAATVNWGSAWRMPTKDEMISLINNCYWLAVPTQNGQYTKLSYVVFKAKNDADKGKHPKTDGSGQPITQDEPVATYDVNTDTHICLPAAGYRDDTTTSELDLHYADKFGYYYTSSLTLSAANPCYLYFENNRVDYFSGKNRCCGLSVRPVYK